MRYAVTNWRELALIAAAVAVITGGIIAWRRRSADPADAERQRRSYLNRVGRIVEGQVLEILEQPRGLLRAPRRGLFGRRENSAPGNGGHKLLFYTYSISGVTYETAQDITELEESACLGRLVVGQPASVKYDPANPCNSILIADDWSGLH